jgi:hypothetical protein
MLSPVLDYRMILPKDVSPYDAYLKLAPLGEEDPSLGISWRSESKEIRVSLMGEIQLEVLKRVIYDRFGLAVEFDEGSIACNVNEETLFDYYDEDYLTGEKVGAYSYKELSLFNNPSII